MASSMASRAVFRRETCFVVSDAEQCLYPHVHLLFLFFLETVFKEEGAGSSRHEIYKVRAKSGGMVISLLHDNVLSYSFWLSCSCLQSA